MSITLGAAAALGGISAAGSLAQSGINYAMQKDAQAFNAAEALKQREFEAGEAEKARQFSAQQRDTAVTSQLNQMKAAGLNIGALGSAGSVSGVSTPGSISAHGSSASSPLNNAGSFSNVAATAFNAALDRVVSQNKNTFLRSFRGHMLSQTGQLVNQLNVVLSKGD